MYTSPPSHLDESSGCKQPEQVARCCLPLLKFLVSHVRRLRCGYPSHPTVIVSHPGNWHWGLALSAVRSPQYFLKRLNQQYRIAGKLVKNNSLNREI
jgi:hypothetical protein